MLARIGRIGKLRYPPCEVVGVNRFRTVNGDAGNLGVRSPRDQAFVVPLNHDVRKANRTQQIFERISREQGAVKTGCQGGTRGARVADGENEVSGRRGQHQSAAAGQT